MLSSIDIIEYCLPIRIFVMSFDCLLGMMISILFYYLVAVNIVTFFVYGMDKRKAGKGEWRISEATLLLLAFGGGSIGAWLGMKVWHHKTKHKKFRYGIPVIIVFQMALWLYFSKWLGAFYFFK